MRSGSLFRVAGRAGVLVLAAVVCLPAAQAQGKKRSNGTILLDAWFNSQTRKDAAGKTEYYHYKWNDTTVTGYSLLGEIFRSEGVATKTLYSAPTLKKLSGAQFYMIVSPDTKKWNAHPHPLTEADADQIAAWVRRGGVLLMMANDPANADLPELDRLADKFGLHFNDVLVHHVIGDEIAMGRIDVPARPPFSKAYVIYMKDTCSLQASGDAVPLLVWKGDTLMAKARYGRGLVVAVTDPWLYNEYTDGKKLPAPYDNYGAGKDFVGWLVGQRAALIH
jgi:unsaturated rhamnogalacturonyl hydrolase